MLKNRAIVEVFKSLDEDEQRVVLLNMIQKSKIVQITLKNNTVICDQQRINFFTFHFRSRGMFVSTDTFFERYNRYLHIVTSQNYIVEEKRNNVIYLSVDNPQNLTNLVFRMQGKDLDDYLFKNRDYEIYIAKGQTLMHNNYLDIHGGGPKIIKSLLQLFIMPREEYQKELLNNGFPLQSYGEDV